MWRIFLAIVIGSFVLSCQTPTNDLPALSVVLVPGVGRNEVQWAPVTGADRYRVVCTSSSSALAGGTQETGGHSILVEGVVPGVDYTVTVTALTGDQPVARSVRSWRSEGWTWVSAPVVLSTISKQDTQVYEFGEGNTVVFITTTTITTERLERLDFGAGGLTRTTWFRETTKTGQEVPIVVDKNETTVAGVWVRPWVEFSAGGTGRTTFSPDRTTFTLDNAPGVPWHQSR